jgi:excisionase family DNA binding protein
MTKADTCTMPASQERAAAPKPCATPPRPTTAARLPRLLAVSEVAELLQVCSKTVRRWIARRELRTHRLGRQLRIAEEDLTAFLAQRRK